MKLVPTSFALHPEDECAITGDRTTHIRLCDEGGGPFVAIFQWQDGEEQCIRLDFEEIPQILSAVNKLAEAIND